MMNKNAKEYLKKNTLKVLISFIILSIIFMLVYLIMNVFVNEHKYSSVTAFNAQVELNSSDVDNSFVQIEGEWAFFPNVFIDYDEIFKTKIPPNLITINSNLINYNKLSMKQSQLGTYHMRILVPKSETIYGLRSSFIRTASTIYINGEMKLSNGIPSLSKNDNKPFNKPFTVFFTAPDGYIDIVIHFANHELAFTGGLSHPIFIGESNAIMNFHNRLVYLDTLLILILLISILFFGVLSFFTNKLTVKKVYPYVAYIGLLIGHLFYTSSHSERLILSIFPNMPYVLFNLLQAIPALIFVFSLTNYLYLFYRTNFTKYATYSINIVTSIYFVFVLITEPFIASKYAWLSTFLVVLTLLYILAYLIFMAISGSKKSIPLFLSVLSFGISAYIETIAIYTTNDLSKFLPLQSIVFILLQFYILANILKQYNTEQEVLISRLIEEEKTKDDFLIKTSHELKIPLNSILNLLHSFSSIDRTLTDAQHQDISLMKAILHRLMSLIDDVKDLTDSKYHSLKMNMAVVDSMSIIDAVVRCTEFTRPLRAVKIITSIPMDLPFLWADEYRLKQIMHNLLDNAVKYTHSGIIEISATYTESAVSIVISDTGIGMTEEFVASILSQDKNTDHTHKPEYGLGLPIVQELMKQLNGNLQIKSTVNIGTTVTFTIPKADKIQLSTYYPQVTILSHYDDQNLSYPITMNHEATITIYLVDDQVHALHEIINILRQRQYKIVAFLNNDNLMNYINVNGKPDLLIIDYIIPSMSGVKLIEHIRTSYNMVEVPILITIFESNPSDIQTVLNAGANDIIIKPISSPHLLNRIDTMLRLADATKQEIELESKLLLSQIQPHFIFNALTAIASTIHTNPMEGRELLLKFATYLRLSFSLKLNDKLIPLSSELEYIEIYSEIQKLRYKRLLLKIDCNVNASLKILPLSIEPLVENAIQHGLQQTEGEIEILVQIKQLGNKIHFHVIDNGCGLSNDQFLKAIKGETDSLALYNINLRLKRYYDTSIKLYSTDKGTDIGFELKDDIFF